MKILILCTGNSCRSQMAHGFLQSFDKNIKVCSAGTQPANKVNQTAIKVMREVSIDISKHTPKNVDQYLGDVWDYVITVCDHANETCPLFLGKVKYRLHFGFDDPSQLDGNDEYILNEFRKVRNAIKQKFDEFYRNEVRKRI